MYEEARDQLRTHDQGDCKQEHREVLPLYEEAARVHGQFGELVKRMQADGLQVSFDAKAMKKTARIVEKAALRPDDPGAVDRVCDIVRAMVTAHSMKHVVAAMQAFMRL